jgi:hypothetical protein
MPRGIKGTKQTIKKMHKLVALGKIDPTLHKIASWIRLSVPADNRSNSRELADAVFWWVKKHGKFQRDPFQIERIEHPIEGMRPVIEARIAGTYDGPALFVGDCDFYTIMLPTLGGLLGFQYSFETVKVDASRPDEFSHIYPALMVNGEWIAYDASSTEAEPNWRPPVDAKLFGRWPEEEIEKTLGMGGMNGIGDGMGNQNGQARSDDHEPGYFPRDYVGDGIPRTMGHGKMTVPKVPFGDFGVHIPRAPAIPRSEYEPTIRSMRKKKTIEPWQRDITMENAPYSPRPMYEPEKPYIFAHPPYPPRWPWARQVETFINQPAVLEYTEPSPMTTETKYIYGAGYQGYGMGDMGEFGQTAPEMMSQASELEAQAKKLRESANALRMTAQAVPGGQGGAMLAQADEMIRQAVIREKQAADLRAAATAKESVSNTVEVVIDDLVKQIPSVSEAYVGKMKADYQERIEAARARVAEAKAREAEALSNTASFGSGYTPPSDWKTPLVVGGIAAAAFAAYLAFSKKKG